MHNPAGKTNAPVITGVHHEGFPRLMKRRALDSSGKDYILFL